MGFGARGVRSRSFCHGNITGPAAGATAFYHPAAAASASKGIASDLTDGKIWVAPCAGIVDLLTCTNASALDANDQCVVTMMKGGVATALTVTVPSNAAAGTATQDATNSFTVVLGDKLEIRYVNNALGPGGIGWNHNWRFTPS